MEPVEINVAYHSAREVSIDETRVECKESSSKGWCFSQNQSSESSQSNKVIVPESDRPDRRPEKDRSIFVPSSNHELPTTDVYRRFLAVVRREHDASLHLSLLSGCCHRHRRRHEQISPEQEPQSAKVRPLGHPIPSRRRRFHDHPRRRDRRRPRPPQARPLRRNHGLRGRRRHHPVQHVRPRPRLLLLDLPRLWHRPEGRRSSCRLLLLREPPAPPGAGQRRVHVRRRRRRSRGHRQLPRQVRPGDEGPGAHGPAQGRPGRRDLFGLFDFVHCCYYHDYYFPRRVVHLVHCRGDLRCRRCRRRSPFVPPRRVIRGILDHHGRRR